MKIILAADGSKFTDRAIDFLVANEGLIGGDGEVIAVNVQAEIPLRMRTMMGPATVNNYYKEESDTVLQPISLFLERHRVRHRCIALTGSVAPQLLEVARQEQAGLVVMGTHGHGFLGQALMGSVAQKVLVASEIPVLLVK